MFTVFLDSRSWERNMSTPKVWEKTPKLVHFHHFLTCTSLRKTCQHHKTSQFSPFFGFQEFEEKTCQHQNYSIFTIFWIPGVWEKNMSTPKLVNFPHGSKFQSVNFKTSQFSPFFGFQEFEKKNMSTPKLVNFPHGSKFQSVNAKTSQFSPFFGFQEFEKNMPTQKVWEKNMSTPKLVHFHHFLTCTSLRKNMSTPKLVHFHHFLTCTSLRKTCQHQN